MELMKEQAHDRDEMIVQKIRTGKLFQEKGKEGRALQNVMTSQERDRDQKKISEEHQKHSFSLPAGQKKKKQGMQEWNDIAGFLGKHGKEKGQKRAEVQNHGWRVLSKQFCPAAEGYERKEGAKQDGLIGNDADGFHIAGVYKKKEYAQGEGCFLIG